MIGRELQANDLCGPLVDKDYCVGRCLYLRVRGPSRSWVLRYTALNGARREMGLGRFDSDPATAGAQIEAAKLRALRERERLMAGEDPIDVRAKARAEKKLSVLRARGMTVQRGMRRWVDYETERRRWSGKHLQDVMRSVDAHPPKWFRDLPVCELGSEHVLQALGEMTCSAQSKDRFRQRVSWFCEWLVNSRQIDANAAGVLRIVRGRFQ